MASFQLTNEIGTFDFDSAGGSWTTGESNQIVLITTDGTTLSFPVDWLFNGRNQLTIRSCGVEVFNFATAGLRNSFETRNAVLRVQPDRSNPFVFELRGDWDMDPDHNLTFTAGGVTSTLDGFVSDPLGRFIYHFADKDNRSTPTSWVSWARGRARWTRTALRCSLSSIKRNPVLVILQLPAAAAINRSSNQLAYTYQKGNKTLSIDFQGTLTDRRGSSRSLMSCSRRSPAAAIRCSPPPRSGFSASTGAAQPARRFGTHASRNRTAARAHPR